MLGEYWPLLPVFFPPCSGTWILPLSWILKGSCAKQPLTTTTRCAKSGTGGRGDFWDPHWGPFPTQRRETEPLLPPVKEQAKAQKEEVPPTLDEGSTGSDACCKTLNVDTDRKETRDTDECHRLSPCIPECCSVFSYTFAFLEPFAEIWRQTSSLFGSLMVFPANLRCESHHFLSDSTWVSMISVFQLYLFSSVEKENVRDKPVTWKVTCLCGVLVASCDCDVEGVEACSGVMSFFRCDVDSPSPPSSSRPWPSWRASVSLRRLSAVTVPCYMTFDLI